MRGAPRTALAAAGVDTPHAPAVIVRNNDYSWGNFKGDENAWMEKGFDAFLSLAN
jgi:hypothetical protein